jgi:hypothetical protein
MASEPRQPDATASIGCTQIKSHAHAEMTKVKATKVSESHPRAVAMCGNWFTGY